MDWTVKLFDTSPGSLLGTVLGTALFYVAIVAVLRLTGKRSLSQIYAVDFAVAVAIGSVFASVMLLRDVSLWSGIAGIGTLALLQVVVSRLTSKGGTFSRIATAKPRLLLYDGRALPNAMRAEAVGSDVLEQAARGSGFTDTTQLLAVVLEADGSFSAIGPSDARPGPAFVTLLDRARQSDPDLIPKVSP